jgi:hypothetical protein
LVDTDKQIEHWSKLYGREITQQEYAEIYQNLNGFFSILEQWDAAEKVKSENGKNFSNRN